MGALSQPDMKPSPLLHCEKVYFKMRQEATEVLENEVPMLVWEGFTTHLMKDLELAVPYYSTIRRALLDMSCVRQLRRGGGSSPSQWELLKEPTLDLWRKMLEDAPKQVAQAGSVNSATKGDIKHVRQMVMDCMDRIDAMETNMKYLVEMFNNQLKKGA